MELLTVYASLELVLIVSCAFLEQCEQGSGVPSDAGTGGDGDDGNGDDINGDDGNGDDDGDGDDYSGTGPGGCELIPGWVDEYNDGCGCE